MLSKYKLNQLYFKDTQFANLMTRRIFNVLLIANPYDAFMLEDVLMKKFLTNILPCRFVILPVFRRFLQKRRLWHCLQV